MCLAMLLTVTRASQMGFMIAAFIILLFSGSRKLILAAVLLTLPIAIGALLFLQQTRQIGVADAADPSTQYRATMWRDGFRLWTQNPRHFVFGIGMDSVKKHWQEWGMFDGGRLPIGHFHSTPVQIAVERGLPALLLWLAILGIYWRTLWKSIWGGADIERRGILLGCLAGSIGFFVSGFVHYNLGDSEVAMVFFILMGLGMRVSSLEVIGPDHGRAAPAQVSIAA
jgi:O-antigen ligase